MNFKLLKYGLFNNEKRLFHTYTVQISGYLLIQFFIGYYIVFSLIIKWNIYTAVLMQSARSQQQFPLSGWIPVHQLVFGVYFNFIEITFSCSELHIVNENTASVKSDWKKQNKNCISSCSIELSECTMDLTVR